MLPLAVLGAQGFTTVAGEQTDWKPAFTRLEGHQGSGTADAQSWFPDYDCVRVPQRRRSQSETDGEPLLAWEAWLQRLETHRGDGLLQRSAEALQVLAAGGSGENDLEQAHRAPAAKDCATGLVMADVLRALVCYEHGGGPGPGKCYDGFESRAREGMHKLGVRVLLGTRWPIYDALNSESWTQGLLSATSAHEMDCFGIEEPILDWTSFKRLFDREDWYQAAVDVAYGPELEKGWRAAALECPLGFVVANSIKAMLCAHTESICFRAHAILIGEALSQTPLHDVVASGWPVFSLLAHVGRAVRRHRFHLDFTPDELLPLALGSATTVASANVAPVSATMRSLVSVLGILQPVIFAATNGDGSVSSTLMRLVFVTMAHGPRFSPYVPRFIERARALGIGDALLVFCLDEQACDACKDAEGNCVQGTPSILNKFTLPLVLLFEEYDVMWLDLDVFLFQDPSQTVFQQAMVGGYELLISGAFNVDCVCSGIIVYRNAERTRRWLAELLAWMYDHPYEHDQKAVSAFLRAGERVAFEEELPISQEDTPYWAFLDPETEFVSARHVDDAGWTGDPDKIVAFHLLHGDSDDSYASRQFAARYGLGVGYTPLLDLFFNRTDVPELYTTAVLPHHILPELKDALWQSRWPHARPAEPRRCNETVPMRY